MYYNPSFGTQPAIPDISRRRASSAHSLTQMRGVLYTAGLEAAAWAVTTTAYRLRSTDNVAVVLMGPYAMTPREAAAAAASAADATVLAASASSPPESSLTAGQVVGDAPKYELHEWLVELGLGREPMTPPHLHRPPDASQVRENEPQIPCLFCWL